MDREDPGPDGENAESTQRERRRICSRYKRRLFCLTFLVMATLVCLYVFHLTLPSPNLAPSKKWWGRVRMNFLVNISGMIKKSRLGLLSVSNFTDNANVRKAVCVPTVANSPTSRRKAAWGPAPYQVAYPGDYSFVLDEPDACREEEPFLVLMVPVAPHDWMARYAIRRTWGKEKLVLGKKVLLFFMLGLPGGLEPEWLLKQLHSEQAVHHDLLQGDFQDSYSNLTIKAIMIQEWVASRCPSAPYGMKIDSDMFLNVHNLVKMLLAFPEPQQDYITGLLTRDAEVKRNPSSKWYLPLEVYPDPTFPSYPLGMGYVFSTDLSRKIVEASKQMKPVYIEDVHLGMCLKRLGISPKHPPSPALFREHKPKLYNRCHYSQVITTLLDSPEMLISYWEDLQKPGPPC